MAFFVLLTWDILDIASVRDAICDVRGRLQVRITSNRVVEDMKQCMYMNKQRLLYTSVESNFQVSQILVHFSRSFNKGPEYSK